MAYDVFFNNYRKSDVLNYILAKLLIESHEITDELLFSGARGPCETLLKNIQEFMDVYPTSEDDAMLLYYALTVHLQEMFSSMWDLIQNTTNIDNQHRCLHINKQRFNKFIELCERRHSKYVNQLKEQSNIDIDADKYDVFYQDAMQYRERQDYTNSDTFAITTRELEEMFYTIGTNTPYNMTNFIQFLLDNQIKLPLSHHRCELAPILLLNYHNDTVNNAFIVEDNDTMCDMDEIRADYFDGQTLIEKNKNAIKLKARPIHTM